MAEAEWTDTDLDLLHSLHAAGDPLDQIARRLGRSEAALRDKLPAVLARQGAVPIPGDEGPNRWYGSDEEGDVIPPARSGEAGDTDDNAAWVNTADGPPPPRD